MRRPVIFILLLLCLAIAAMGVMLMFSSRGNSIYGGFSRNFVEQAVATADTVDLGFDSYYIAGQTSHFLYLGNLVAPRHIVSVNIHTGDTMHVALTLDNAKRIALGDVKCRVDSPQVYLYDGTAPVIFQGSLSERIVRPSRIHVPYFLEMEPLGKDRYAFRSLGSDGLARLVYADEHEVAVPGLLTRQVDGILCTAGMLLCGTVTREVVYVYFYRNEILVMDSCLNLVRTAHTLDTIKTAKITVASTSNGSESTFSSPPVLVNRQSALFNRYLVINSRIRADNDDALKLKQGSAFDVYDWITGEYIHSMYIPHYRGDEAKYHRLFEGRLAVIYDRSLLIYSIPMQ